jgi:hypothetical protein
MGKASRRKQEKVHARAQVDPSGSLTLIVATTPASTQEGLSVLEDVRLTRAALLYADRVELWSPAASFIAVMAAGVQQDPLTLLDALDQMSDGQIRNMKADPGELRPMVRSVRRWSQMPRSERRGVPTAHRKAFEGATETIVEMARGESSVLSNLDEQWQAGGGLELNEAAEAGLLDIRYPQWITGANSGRHMEAYVEELRELVAEPSKHVLFDEQMARLLASSEVEGRSPASPQALANAADAGAGTHFIERLSAFPDASMSSVLEARLELADELIHYRRGVAAVTTQLHVGAIDPGFEAEVQRIWRTDVQPALIDLRRAVRGSRIARETAGTLAGDKSFVGAVLGVPGLWFGLPALAPEAPDALAIATSIAAAAVASVRAVHARSERLEAAPRRDLLYLLSLDKQLATRPSP